MREIEAGLHSDDSDIEENTAILSGRAPRRRVEQEDDDDGDGEQDYGESDGESDGEETGRQKKKQKMATANAAKKSKKPQKSVFAAAEDYEHLLAQGDADDQWEDKGDGGDGGDGEITSLLFGGKKKSVAGKAGTRGGKGAGRGGSRGRGRGGRR